MNHFFRISLLFSLLGLSILACQDSKQAENKPLAQSIDGKTIFQKQCVVCHGSDGLLGLNGAKKLPESELTLEERILLVQHGLKTMPAFRNLLSPEEIQAVAEYTLQFKK